MKLVGKDKLERGRKRDLQCERDRLVPFPRNSRVKLMGPNGIGKPRLSTEALRGCVRLGGIIPIGA